MREFLSVVFLVVTVHHVTPFCTDVSYNACKDDSSEHIQPFVEPKEICQQLCKTFNTQDECQFYRYILDNKYGYTCYMYTEPFKAYADHCDSISAPKTVMTECIENVQENSCYVTQSSRCLYDGEVLEKSQAVDWKFCKSLCDTNSGCLRWVYYKESQTCEQLNRADQTCKEVFGPPSLSPMECGEAPPQPTTPQPTQTPDPENCGADEVKFYEDKDNCMMYYQCINGAVTHLTCPDCDKFDSASGYCKQPQTVDCGNRPYDNSCTFTTRGGLCPQDSGYFPVSTECKDYVKCDGGNPQYMKCGNKVDDNGQVQQLLYNDDGIMCDWVYRVSCGTRPVCDAEKNCQCQFAVPVKAGEECKDNTQGVAIRPDPFNCQNKIICIGEQSSETIPCPAGQYYDPSIDNCIKEEAICGERPICAADKTCRCVE